jgi:hypothetical protein
MTVSDKITGKIIMASVEGRHHYLITSEDENLACGLRSLCPRLIVAEQA